MKVLKKIKKVLLVTLGIVYFTFALFMTILLLNFNDYRVTVFGETSLVILKDKVSHEEYQKGDLVLVEAAAPENLQKGETVFVYKVDKMSKTADINIGKVEEVYDEYLTFRRIPAFAVSQFSVAVKRKSGFGKHIGLRFLLCLPYFCRFFRTPDDPFQDFQVSVKISG